MEWRRKASLHRIAAVALIRLLRIKDEEVANMLEQRVNVSSKLCIECLVLWSASLKR